MTSKYKHDSNTGETGELKKNMEQNTRMSSLPVDLPTSIPGTFFSFSICWTALSSISEGEKIPGIEVGRRATLALIKLWNSRSQGWREERGRKCYVILLVLNSLKWFLHLR